jgi:hypothetical protein
LGSNKKKYSTGGAEFCRYRTGNSANAVFGFRFPIPSKLRPVAIYFVLDTHISEILKKGHH